MEYAYNVQLDLFYQMDYAIVKLVIVLLIIFQQIYAVNVYLAFI
jgi:hypothetical protein